MATDIVEFREARRTWLDAFGKLPPQTRTQRVMLILIESGILYMLFFVRVFLSYRRACQTHRSLGSWYKCS